MAVASMYQIALHALSLQSEGPRAETALAAEGVHGDDESEQEGEPQVGTGR